MDVGLLPFGDQHIGCLIAETVVVFEFSIERE